MTSRRAMRQLVLLGGGGFSQEKNRALDRHFLAQTGKKRPRVLFIGTASGDAESYRYKFYEAMAELPCRATHLSLFAPPSADLASFVDRHDAIFVGGGNTRSLLALWREWGLDAILRRAYRRGTVIGGVSAGMIAWFDWGVTDSIPGALTPLACLGWLPGSACPHYDSETERRPTYRRLVESGAIPGGFAVDDGVALHFVDGALHDIVSARPSARAYLVERIGRRVRETPIVPRQIE
jgi:peptidase E